MSSALKSLHVDTKLTTVIYVTGFKNIILQRAYITMFLHSIHRLSLTLFIGVFSCVGLQGVDYIDLVQNRVN
jgi:hypothetical protein